VPALLLEWQQTPDGWQGRVVRPVLDMEDGLRVPGTRKTTGTTNVHQNQCGA